MHVSTALFASASSRPTSSRRHCTSSRSASGCSVTFSFAALATSVAGYLASMSACTAGSVADETRMSASYAFFRTFVSASSSAPRICDGVLASSSARLPFASFAAMLSALLARSRVSASASVRTCLLSVGITPASMRPTTTIGLCSSSHSTSSAFTRTWRFAERTWFTSFGHLRTPNASVMCDSSFSVGIGLTSCSMRMAIPGGRGGRAGARPRFRSGSAPWSGPAHQTSGADQNFVFCTPCRAHSLCVGGRLARPVPRLTRPTPSRADHPDRTSTRAAHDGPAGRYRD